jgi:dienelactone hydrolase
LQSIVVARGCPRDGATVLGEKLKSLPKRLRIALACGAILALAGAAALWVSQTPPAKGPAMIEEFAAATGFAAPIDRRILVPALPSRWFPNADGLLQWQRTLRMRLAELFRRPDAPGASPLILERTSLPAPAGLVRERLQFAAADGMRIPAILQYPSERRIRPAILVIPGHVPSDDSGLRQLTDAADSYQHAAATALAQHGFVTLAFELRGFGLLGLRHGAEHSAVAYNALLNGSFYKALVIDDASRALGVLRALPHVDRKRVGVTGASMGGELAVNLAALDESIAAIAASGYGGNAGLLNGLEGPDTVMVHYCHIIPGAWSFLRREDMTLLLAPRPTLIVRGEHEYQHDDLFATSAAAAWRSLGARERFELKVMLGREHEFFVLETAAFFQRSLAAE